MSDLENFARKWGRKIAEELPDGAAFLLIVADMSDIGSASSLPRNLAVMLAEAYKDRIKALETGTLKL